MKLKSDRIYVCEKFEPTLDEIGILSCFELISL